MIVAVCGCGPSLSRSCIPENSFVIGVNRSYEVVEPHIICTSDVEAFASLKENRKEPILFEDHFRGGGWKEDSEEVPHFFYMQISTNVEGYFIETAVKNSGAFAIWIASRFKPSKLYLSGFGGRGHFYGKYEEPEMVINASLETLETAEESLARREDRNVESVAKALTYINCEVVQN